MHHPHLDSCNRTSTHREASTHARLETSCPVALRQRASCALSQSRDRANPAVETHNPTGLWQQCPRRQGPALTARCNFVRRQ